jgi:uncharacterized protein (TIGR00661 family)
VGVQLGHTRINLVRILYGVFGYGRGHATRALAVLPTLAQRHELLVLAGGDAFELLRERYCVVQLPSMGYVYGPAGEHSLFATLAENTAALFDALCSGRVARELEGVVRRFRPHVAVSDAEPFTHHIAARMGIPRVSFDHIGMLAHCRVEVPGAWRLALGRDVIAYRLLTGRPDHVIVSSFFPAEPRRPGVECVGPLLRPAARELRPRVGDYILAYFNRAQHQLSERLADEFQKLGRRVVLYGGHAPGQRGNIELRMPSDTQFVRDLAGCLAVVSTAGNQLVGECIHFRKPLLVTPENCLEQHVNAAAVERLGIGQSVRASDLDAEVLERFLSAHSTWVEALDTLARTPRADALTAIERSVLDLGRRQPSALARTWRYA